MWWREGDRHRRTLGYKVTGYHLSVSTDYVFDGTRPPYRPDDAPNPLNAYGRSKLDGERALLRSGAQACVLRLPLLYGPVIDWGESAGANPTPAIGGPSRGVPPAAAGAWGDPCRPVTPCVAG